MNAAKSRLTALALAALATAGCAPVTQSTAPSAETATPVREDMRDRDPATDSERYSVVTASSRLVLLTFREGAMARLGHNHAIASSGLTGTIWLAPDLADSTARIVLPVESLEVDPPQVRAEAGSEFEDPVPEDDRIATRSNMLGPGLLDADNHAFVSASCADLDAESSPAAITCDLTVAGRTVALRLPVDFEISGNQIRVAGEATVTHTQLGLSPFSAAGGAIRVADGITVRYDIVAQRLSAPRPAD